jgi:hypothetical protein
VNTPGTVYMGQLTGPVHQVHHLTPLSGESLVCDCLGPLSVTIMARTSLFPGYPSRLRTRTPSPVEFLHLLARVFRESFANDVWRLPSLHEAQQYDAESLCVEVHDSGCEP